MYINTLLALVSIVSGYALWQRISEKMPELAAMPDEEISVMLQKNRAKLHVFILHLFHFRSFYQSHHYQDKFWNFLAKILFKIHILVLRFDNSLINLIKNVRAKTKPYSNSDSVDLYKELQEKIPAVHSKTHRISEVRVRGRND